MGHIHFHELRYTFRSDIALLDSISANLLPGWTGLVGANGCGKSTLLRLLAGQLTPDGGKLDIPRAALIHYCPQELPEPDSAIHRLAASQDADAHILRGSLELDQASLSRWNSLSAGERKRWQVGAALFIGCNTLLLDEPANHLDQKSRELLIRQLQKFMGSGIVVSHDRELLDRLTNNTWWLAGGKLETYADCYTMAEQMRTEERRKQGAAYEKASQEAKKLDRRLHDARQKQAAADKKRTLGRHAKPDSDARTLGAKTVKAWAEDRLGRNVGILREASRKAHEATPAFQPDPTLGRSLFLDFQSPEKPVLAKLRQTQLTAGNKELLRDIDIRWGKKDRIRIAGPNGAGKSTLLRALLATCTLPSDNLLVLPQEHSDEDIRQLLAMTRALASAERGRVCTLLAALGCSPAILGQNGGLSPGEARKLHLAFGLGKLVHGVVLDEPTNHLDILAVGHLAEALRAYPGALLLISHDDAFAKSCTDLEWRINAKHLSVSGT